MDEKINHKINVISNDIATMKIQVNNLIKLMGDLNKKIDNLEKKWQTQP